MIWISSSSSDPPCWWQLVKALKKIEYGCLAQELEAQYSKCCPEIFISHDEYHLDYT